MIEGLSSILYAASRVGDMPELTTLHKIFAQKYGKEYVTEASSDVTCSRWMVNDNLRRCLTVEPPDPALKLETLSEIAQEYGVEWDMDRARRDLLPPDDLSYGGTVYADPAVAHLAATPHPSSAMGTLPMNALPQSGNGGGGYNARPPPHGQGGATGGYVDANAAAAAAAAAAKEAHAAAQYAAQFARQPPGGHYGGPGSNGGGGGVANGQQQAPPPQGWLMGLAPTATASTGNISAATAGHLPTTSSAPSDIGSYRVQSAADIQQAYDAAQGPPVKSSSQPGTPNATAATAAGEGGEFSDAGGTGRATAPGSAHVAGAVAPGVAVAPSSSDDMEYDELQKRFEMLKRS